MTTLFGVLADAVVVVYLFDGGLCPFVQDMPQPGLSGALRHKNDGLLAQPSGGPGHAPAVVAVGSGEEGELTHFFPHPGIGQLFVA